MKNIWKNMLLHIKKTFKKIIKNTFTKYYLFAIIKIVLNNYYFSKGNVLLFTTKAGINFRLNNINKYAKIAETWTDKGKKLYSSRFRAWRHYYTLKKHTHYQKLNTLKWSFKLKIISFCNNIKNIKQLLFF